MTVLHAYAADRPVRGGNFFSLEAYDFVAPLIFDHGRSMGAPIKKSSTRFDRVFGGQREMRTAGMRGILYEVAPIYCDDELRANHPFGDSLTGLGFFLQTLYLASTADGGCQLPTPEGIRLIAYLKAASTQKLQVAEAVRTGDSFELDVFDLNEASPWDGSTFVLDVAPRHVG